ncbi:HAMP domain-containing protein, partial [Oharaeibacter diazotrophicus]
MTFPRLTLGLRFMAVIGVAVAVMGLGTLGALYQFRAALVDQGLAGTRAVAEDAVAAVERAKGGDAAGDAAIVAALAGLRTPDGKALAILGADGAVISAGAERLADGASTALLAGAKVGAEAIAHDAVVDGAAAARLSFARPVADGRLVVVASYDPRSADIVLVRIVLVIAAFSGPMLLVFLAWAWRLGRGISRDLATISTAVGRLAAGDTTVSVSGVGGDDEVGEIATAVEVFRTSMVENDRMKAEENARIADRAARAARLERIVHAFREEAGQIVGFVRASADAMNGTAGDLTAVSTVTRSSAEAAEQTAARDAAAVADVADAA